jgi:hypothetical protein
VLGQFGCPVAGTDLVTRVGVGDPEAKPAHAIARTEGDVVVSEHLARRDDGRYTVWIAEAQRGHVRDRMTQAERCRLPCLVTRRGAILCLAAALSWRRDGPTVTSGERRCRSNCGTADIEARRRLHTPLAWNDDRDPRWSARDPTRFRRKTRHLSILGVGPRRRAYSWAMPDTDAERRYEASRVYNREYYAANAERLRAAANARRAADPDSARAREREPYAANRARALATDAAWRAANA